MIKAELILFRRKLCRKVLLEETKGTLIITDRKTGKVEEHLIESQNEENRK